LLDRTGAPTLTLGKEAAAVSPRFALFFGLPFPFDTAALSNAHLNDDEQCMPP